MSCSFPIEYNLLSIFSYTKKIKQFILEDAFEVGDIACKTIDRFSPSRMGTTISILEERHVEIRLKFEDGIQEDSHGEKIILTVNLITEYDVED